MSSSKQRFAAMAFTFEAGLGILAILVGRGFGFDPLATLGFDKPIDEVCTACLWGVLAALPLLIGLVVVDRQPKFLAAFKERISTVVLPLFEGMSLVELAAISAAAGFGEELFFRGLLQGGLQAWIDQPLAWVPAIVVASVVFGVCHWLNATYAVLAAVIGLYLGGLFLLTTDLVAPIVTHGLYDFVAILYLTRASTRSPGSPTSNEENETDPA